MKKLLTLLLSLVLAMVCFTGCKLNKDGEVSVLWSDMNDSFVVELADSMDRSMYLYNLDYTHYDAENDADRQMQQLTDVLNAGCTAVIVKAVNATIIQNIVDAAKAKDVPVVFVETEVDASILNSYSKAFAVNSASNYIEEYTGMVKAYLTSNFDKHDRNKDGKLTIYADAEVDAVVDGIAADYQVVRADAIAYDGTVELIFTNSDEKALDVLLALREQGYNKDKLQTHLVGLFTVGMDLNAGAVIDDGKDRTGKDAEDYQNKLNAYSIMSAIDAGFIQGAVVINDDGVTETACQILVKFYKNKGMEHTANKMQVKYTTYGV